jgi:hypothetical protein
MNCEICTETFTKRRQPVKCQYCDFTACVECCKTFILSKNKPKCMNNSCTGEWSRKHIRENFTHKFINTELKEHQKNVLIETQMALMPETQLIIEETKRKARLTLKINELKKERHVMRERNTQIDAEKLGEYNQKKKALENLTSWHTNYYGGLYIEQLNKALEVFNNDVNRIPDDGLHDTLKSIVDNHKLLNDKIQANFHVIETYKTISYPDWNEYVKQRNDEIRELDDRIEKLRRKRDNGLSRQRTEFIRKCGDPECRGFLSTRWKCGLCEKTTCLDCHEVKVEDETQIHTCDVDCVATIKLLKTDTRNCPSCQASIFKIDGCDQMWCTMCKTGFSWATGKIEMKLHNPHYYEWRRQNGGLDREPGDVPRCDTPQDIVNRIINYYNMDDTILEDQIIELCRRCIHISAYNTNPTPPDFENDRIRYLNNDINAEMFKNNLVRANKAYSKKHEIYAVYELLRFCDVLDETGQGEPRLDILEEINKIVDYVNGCFADIAFAYGSISKHEISYGLEVSKISMKKIKNNE